MNSQENTFQKIISGSTPVLVDFYAEWCMPCRVLSPILTDLSREMGDEIRVLKVDVDKNPEVARKYGIYSVPSIFLFRKGNVVWKGSGARPKEELKRIIRSNALTNQVQ